MENEKKSIFCAVYILLYNYLNYNLLNKNILIIKLRLTYTHPFIMNRTGLIRYLYVNSSKVQEIKKLAEGKSTW